MRLATLRMTVEQHEIHQKLDIKIQPIRQKIKYGRTTLNFFFLINFFVCVFRKIPFMSYFPFS
jgi:hypothetical protein